MTNGNGEKAFDAAVLDRSVLQRPEQPLMSPGAGNAETAIMWMIGQFADEIVPWGRAYKQRDRQLRNFITEESIFASALGTVCARNAGFSWKVDGPKSTATRMQEMLESANLGAGWADLMIKTTIDLSTQDSGAFWEIVRQADSESAAVIGINHLDAARCWSTGYPKIPVIYQDILGGFHKLPWYSVVHLAEMPAPQEYLYDLQFCLDGDAGVLMPDGKYQLIRDLVNSNYDGDVMSLGPAGQLEPKKVTKLYRNPLNGRRLISLRTRGAAKGRHHSWVTADHPVLTPDGWRDAGDLRTGDEVVSSEPALNARQRSLVIGMLLGDSHITKTGRFSFYNAVAHADWMDCKERALAGFTVKERISRLSAKSSKWSDLLLRTVEATAEFRDLREQFYPDGKHIAIAQVRTNFSLAMLATWYLDDGSVSQRQHGLGLRHRGPGYTRAVAQIGHVDQTNAQEIATFLTEQGYECRATPDRLLFSSDGSQRLYEAIAAYVPPSMRYKLPHDQYELADYQPSLWDMGQAERYVDIVIIGGSQSRKRSDAVVYCLDVEDNHNFVTADIVVHNCALTRMLRAVQILKNIGTYKYEKTGGRSANVIHMVKGVTTQQMQDAVQQAKMHADSAGLSRYMSPVIIGSIDPMADVGHDTIELTGLPDNYDEETTFKQYINQIALAFMTDYQEFAPLPGGGLGTSAQSEVQHMKNRGKGPALFMKLISQALNFRVFPQNVEFEWDEQDSEVDAIQAANANARAQTRAIRIASQEITPEVARQLAHDDGDLSQELLNLMGVEDTTLDVTIDDESAATNQNETGRIPPNAAPAPTGAPPQQLHQPAPTGQQPPPQLAAAKEQDDRAGPPAATADRLAVEDEVQAAVERAFGQIRARVSRRIEEEL